MSIAFYMPDKLIIRMIGNYFSSDRLINRSHFDDLSTDLQAGVGPVVVGAVLTGDASCRPTLTLVPEAHPPLFGLLEDLDLRLGHCRA